MLDDELTIGTVAARSGMAVSAIRFYESQGLIAASRAGSGHRRFHRRVLRRIAFIQVAQKVGLTLDEIGSALAGLPSGAAPSARDWRRVSATWRPLLDERIRILQGLRDELDSCIGCGCLSLQRCRLANPGDRAGASGPGPRYLLSGTPSGATP